MSESTDNCGSEEASGEFSAYLRQRLDEAYRVRARAEVEAALEDFWCGICGAVPTSFDDWLTHECPPLRPPLMGIVVRDQRDHGLHPT